ncbi:sugar ABC transporter permease [Streptomyces sp. cg36]|uniref:sugar ABC transporter permease n=1 Tax=Streptomyces sp. cg36 TaxID=3238798 RepID=UPI0034E30072
MSAPEWAGPALDALLGRVAATRDHVGARFPLFAEPGSGEWTTTRRGSWTGGFWAGLLWLRARRTGRPTDHATARACAARLAEWLDADTSTRGLIFWYGTVPAHEDPDSGALRARAALACRNAFEPDHGVVPWGTAFGGPRLAARTDGVPGTVPLLATADPAAADSHLRRHLTVFTDSPPTWSRGRAWLLLGVAEGVRHLGAQDLAPTADRLTGPALVPLADERHPDGPLDTSAAAITAYALLLLDREAEATAILDRLVHSHLTTDGRLLDGCYEWGEGTGTEVGAGTGTAVRHELIWGSFFLASALEMLVEGLTADG